jgi:hypothetical protein
MSCQRRLRSRAKLVVAPNATSTWICLDQGAVVRGPRCPGGPWTVDRMESDMPAAPRWAGPLPFSTELCGTAAR